MKFKYLKGSEIDFIGAPDNAVLAVNFKPNGIRFFGKDCYYIVNGALFTMFTSCGNAEFKIPEDAEIVAHRVPTADYSTDQFPKLNPEPAEKLGHGLDCEECDRKKEYAATVMMTDGLTRDVVTTHSAMITSDCGKFISFRNENTGSVLIIAAESFSLAYFNPLN